MCLSVTEKRPCQEATAHFTGNQGKDWQASDQQTPPGVAQDTGGFARSQHR